MYRTNRTWLLAALALSALLLTLHLFALRGFWYWEYHWSDIPMHVLGGAAVGSFLFAFGTARRTRTYFFCMLAVFVVWKLIEYYGHVSVTHPYYWFENIKDIVVSLIGSCIPFILARKTSWR